MFGKQNLKKLTKAVLPAKVSARLWSERQFRRYSRRYPAKQAVPHSLSGELVVSLTSYPPRFPTLHLTIESLLRQGTKPDRLILWVAARDLAELPPQTRRLERRGLDIRSVPDVRSYKKLVFALLKFPSAFIATADDDVFYQPNWLGELVAGQTGTEGVITCHRAHRMVAYKTGMAPYLAWENDVQDLDSRRPSKDLMATGLGGILYPPGSLHEDATCQALYERFAPSGDDLWFHWCARRAGRSYVKVGDRFPFLWWEASQDFRLFSANITENDGQIAELVRVFGNPMNMTGLGPRQGECA